MAFLKSRRLAVFVVVLALIAGALGAYAFWPANRSTPPDIHTLDSTVEKGRYLATIGNCVTCHTTRNGQLFAGGVQFQTGFGVLYSTNITSDQNTGIGRWSFGDFYQAMKHGTRPDGIHLYPAFPYTSFSRLSDADIASIYLYMQTVKPVSVSARKNHLKFPYNLRFTLRAWNKLFHSSETYVHDAGQSAEWNRGAYLIQGIAHCGACHTPRNFLGAERADLALSGGVLYDEVSHGKSRQWSAVNLTSANTGLGAWSANDIQAYLKTGDSVRAVVHGPMTEVVLNSTRYFKDDDIRAIASYLKALPATGDSNRKTADPKQLAAGEITYTVHCGTCHLPTGLGDQTLGVTLAGNAIVQANDPSSLINVILYAPHLPPPPFVSDRTRMKPFGKRLSDEEIANLATYIRANFGNQAGMVSTRQVTQQR